MCALLLKKRKKIVDVSKLQRVVVYAVTTVYGILTRQLRLLTA